jgi:O-methyltransferase
VPEREMKNYVNTCFHNTTDHTEFLRGVQKALKELGPYGIFCGDNIFTIHRNLSFLDDEVFMSIFERNTQSDNRAMQETERSIIWRTHVLSWAARSCLKFEGDFVECACYKGTSAKIICEYLDFNSTGKHYYLYDLFEHEKGMDHHAMPGHSKSLYEQVQQRFAEYPNVHVIQGSVPEALLLNAPQKIAFMHLDINSAAAEIGALEILFERIVPGGMLVLDDYGWLAYNAQKQAEDPFFAKRGLRVLELPTGQGLVVKFK